MRLSRGNFNTTRERVSSETLSQQVLLQSGQVKRYATGIYGKNHFLVKAQEKVEEVIRTVLESYECIEVALPILQPKSIWEESKRWEAYNSSGQMFCTIMSNGTFCMAPTAEEAVVEFVKNSVSTYKQLPINIFQIGPKFRNELRSRGGLLRSKEFTMMDAYSFDASQIELVKEYEKMRDAYLEIFDKLGLKVIPVKALNGDMGGNCSEEFMCLSDIGEDTILVNEDFSIGINVEVLEGKNVTEILNKTYGTTINLAEFHKEHCIELGHIFQLGQKYSKEMKAMFNGKCGEREYFYMGCYGIGVSRVLATICERNCDEQGMKWPVNLAPYTFYIVSTEKQQTEAEALYKKLCKEGIKVVIDDRRNMSFGAKIKDAKLFGMPYLVIIGNSYSGNFTYEVEERRTGKKINMTIGDMKEIVQSLKDLK